jgi:hypothetical protein
VLAGWMNAGGGLFATGDHAFLGTYLAGDVPRVSSMRRWRDLGISDNVPSAYEASRIDTIVPVRTIDGQPGVTFEDQSDNVPKPLHLKRYFLWDGLMHLGHTPRSKLEMVRWTPHPILCSPLGAIDILQDHMHEGLVREDGEVALGSDFPGGANRPQPEVIAWAEVRGGNVVYNDFGYTPSVLHRVVPVVSAYDGEPASVGRIVVDSTWHNWLDINVRGTGAAQRINPQTGQFELPSGLLGKNLELVHNYVRNIAQWLSTPSQRESMRNGTFLHIVANTGGWAGLINIRLLLGERATNVLGQAISACERNGLVFSPWWYDGAVAGFRKDSAGALSGPSEEFVSHHVLGAMTEAILELMPTLPRKTETASRSLDSDSTREFQLIGARLDSARRAGVRALAAEWRASLEATAHFLDVIERVVVDDAPPTRST